MIYTRKTVDLWAKQDVSMKIFQLEYNEIRTEMKKNFAGSWKVSIFASLLRLKRKVLSLERVRLAIRTEYEKLRKQIR